MSDAHDHPNDTHSLEELIDNLTSEQASRATNMVYDYLPAEMWEAGRKPSRSRMETVANQVCEMASADVKPVVESMLKPDNLEPKSKACKIVLRQLAENDELRPFVEKSVAHAIKPDMAIDPFSVGAILIAFLAFSSGGGAIKTKGGASFEWKGGAPEMLRELTGVLKALPQGVLEHFK